MKKEHLVLSALGIIILGVIIDRAVSRGNQVNLRTSFGSLSFNETNNEIKRLLVNNTTRRRLT
jgi:hypothetical protein